MRSARTLADLERSALLWWPLELQEKIAKKSPIPLLLKTQELFISVLKLSESSPETFLAILNASRELSANLYLKHLCIISDFGGEMLQRLGREFNKVFPKKNGHHLMEYVFKGTTYTYCFEAMPQKITNKSLLLDGVSLNKRAEITPLYKDVMMILTHGASSTSAETAGLDKCMLGSLLGNTNELEVFIRQRYIHVSRICRGGQANDLGQIAQDKVFDLLREKVPKGIKVTKNDKILSARKGKKGPTFDILLKGKHNLGVEITFQVTTNSVIERKAGQAADRLRAMENDGNYIAYVIDGAGNFNRKTAIQQLARNCHLVTTFKESDLLKIVDFAKDHLC
jgi:hypothetical protein